MKRLTEENAVPVEEQEKMDTCSDSEKNFHLLLLIASVYI